MVITQNENLVSFLSYREKEGLKSNSYRSLKFIFYSHLRLSWQLTGLSWHGKKMKLKNAFGGHILKIAFLSGLIWIQWRDRRPWWLLNISKPRHPGVHILIHVFADILIYELPRSPSQAPHPRLLVSQKQIDHEEDAQLWMSTVITWSMVNASFHVPGAWGRNGYMQPFPWNQQIISTTSITIHN